MTLVKWLVHYTWDEVQLYNSVQIGFGLVHLHKIQWWHLNSVSHLGLFNLSCFEVRVKKDSMLYVISIGRGSNRVFT
jgi:hypothetical protein